MVVDGANQITLTHRIMVGDRVELNSALASGSYSPYLEFDKVGCKVGPYSGCHLGTLACPLNLLAVKVSKATVETRMGSSHTRATEST